MSFQTDDWFLRLWCKYITHDIHNASTFSIISPLCLEENWSSELSSKFVATKLELRKFA